jgi:hypothetical protein
MTKIIIEESKLREIILGTMIRYQWKEVSNIKFKKFINSENFHKDKTWLESQPDGKLVARTFGDFMDFLVSQAKEASQIGDGWISVEDRLPEDFQRVIVGRKCVKNVMKIICYRDKFKDEKYWGESMADNFDSPTHWMPLPEPPSEAGEQGERSESPKQPDNSEALREIDKFLNTRGVREAGWVFAERLKRIIKGVPNDQ